MSHLDFSAAVRRVITAEVNARLAPYREVLDDLAALLARAPRKGAPPPPRRLERAAAAQAAAPAQVAPTPEPARSLSTRLHPRRGATRRRPARTPSLDSSAPEAAEKKVQAVKPFVRRRAKSEGTNGASAQGFDPFDARIAKRFAVGQSVRYRGPDGFIVAKIAAIDGTTGILTLVHSKDDTRLTIPAGSVFSAV
jgi:hypothetical protein